MNIVVFGLAVSSSWGNGHATLWRALGRALGARGHRLSFFEQDVPYYAAHRDGLEFPGIDLHLYTEPAEARRLAARHLREADAAIVTSFCPSGGALADLVCASDVPVRAFYDLDTPVTLARLDAGEVPDYLPSAGLGGFDLVLSYAGGRALTALSERLGARRVAPLYGSVDPAVHRPCDRSTAGAARYDLSYLGTYCPDREAALDELFFRVAESSPDRRFLVAGAQYPEATRWPANVSFVRHLPAGDHPAFFASASFTLNVTREPMAEMGFCPSGRLFEAAACGGAIVTDTWEGLDHFFAPGDEIRVVRSRDDVLEALALSAVEITAMADRARARVLASHTAAHRAAELEALLEDATRVEPYPLPFTGSP